VTEKGVAFKYAYSEEEKEKAILEFGGMVEDTVELGEENDEEENTEIEEKEDDNAKKKDDKKKFAELSDMERKELIEKLEKLREKA
jgi:hypothetical protein